MTCFTPVDTNNCFSNVYIREVVRSEIQKVAECFKGDSAYSIAVSNGYVGTEDEWLASLGGTITDITAVSLEAGSAPSASLGGTPRKRIINLGIPKGEKGKEGIQGIPGPVGLSAYDVAVSNGFNGTKTDWLLAIKGAKGDVGPEGPKGEEGKSTYELSVDYGYSGSEREWLSGIINDTELMSNLNEDLLSIDKAANGDINTTVVTRTGETYPSAKKAISDGIVSLFENGGLPATPFATKALMTASVLIDGDFAMVTEDSANNGLYVKTAGAWVKSAYDPIEVAKLDATARANEAKTQAVSDSKSYTDAVLLEADEASVNLPASSRIPLTGMVAGSYSPTGLFNDSSAFQTSAVIPVIKGECYVLTGLSAATGSRSVITMTNAAGDFIASLDSSIRQKNSDGFIKQFDTKVGVFNSKFSYRNYGVVIPNDGFIRVTTWANPAAPTTRATLYKTDFAGFLANTQIQVPSAVLSSFEKVLYTAKIDSLIVGNGSRSLTYSQVVGTPIKYATVPRGVVSERVAVTKGQYVHVHSTPVSMAFPHIVFEDAAGNYLGQQDIISEYSLSYTGVAHVALNVKSEFTGFFRITNTGDSTSPFLMGVSDIAIDYHRAYLKNNEDILFYPQKSALTSAILADSIQKGNVRKFTEGTANPDSNYTASVPYLLERGKVLEYELDATSYATLAFVLPKDKLVMGSSVLDNELLALNATDLYDMAQGQAWIAAGRPSTPAFFANAKRAKIAYCNDDTDTVVVFLRPNSNSTRFATYKQSKGYNLRVMSKDEYKVIRDKEISDRFTKISKVTKTRATGQVLSLEDLANVQAGSYPPVLMFKGEVLSYLSNYAGGVAAEQLSNLNDNLRFPTVSTDTYFAKAIETSALKPVATNTEILTTVPDSYRFSQVYARETCIVTPNINYLKSDLVGNLDTQGLIADKYYPARVVALKDVKLGVNIEPATYTNGTAVITKSVDGVLAMVGGLSNLFKVNCSFLPKNSYAEAKWWTARTSTSPTAAAISNDSYAIPAFKPLVSLDDKGNFELQSAQAANYSAGFEISEDSLVVNPAYTTQREYYAPSVVYVDPANLLMVDTYEHSLKEINLAKYNDEYKVTSATRLHIPETSGLTFNFCTPNSPSLLYAIYSVVQIIQQGKVIAVLNVKTENQGQSTAALSRKNVNMEFYNDKFQKVYIQFGNYIEEQEGVLKSYLLTDKGHFKDTTSCNTWHSLRTAEPYPKGGVLPNDIYENLAYPTNQKARGTTYGFPVELHRGGAFNSIATLRNKKKRENYGMLKDNKNHILMQADWGIKSIINWDIVDIGYFEMRNPSMKGYVNGDMVFPAGYESVEAASKRIIGWMHDCYKGTVSIRDTYADYIDLDCFLDYALAIAVTGNADAVYNNFLLGTHDSNLWRVYWYDSDGGWGGVSNGSVTPITWMDNKNFFRKLATDMLPELKARYALHRRLGSIDAKVIQNEMARLSDSINSDAKVLDAKYWGQIFDSSGKPLAQKWCKERIDYLDGLYGYIAP